MAILVGFPLYRAKWLYQPRLTDHDPNPPINLELFAATTLPDVGSVRVPGLAPTIDEQAGLSPLVTVGLVPTLQLTVGGGSETTAAPGIGLATAQGLVPDLTRELLATPGLGAITTGGLVPAEQLETGAAPAAGLVALGALAPALYLERLIAPGVGLAQVLGQVPTLAGELQQPGVTLPGVGQVVTGGLSPNALAENQIGPTAGTVVCQGLAPTLQGELAAVPAVGLLSAAGLVPTLDTGATPTQEPIGRSYVGDRPKRRRGTYGPVEPSLSAVVAVTLHASPLVQADSRPGLRVPLGQLGGVDLRAALRPEPAVATLVLDEEARRARVRARRRREEALLVQILMLAA